MKKFKLILLMPLFLLFVGSECRKDLKTTLPPVTQEGAETFGCLVNGQLFRNGGSGFTTLNLIAELFSNNNVLNVDASNGTGSVNQSIGFSIKNMKGPGKYYLTGNNSGGLTDLNGNNFCKYKTDSLDQTSYVNITYFDTIREVVSGTFSFKAKLYQSALGTCDSTHIIDVTEGRFDVFYFKQ